MKLKEDFFIRDDVVYIARELLGKVICTRIDGNVTSGIITETEAYAGVSDKASHAYANKMTARTKTMYGTGGICYVYLCYGIHHLFNFVTGSEGTPHAVLLRGIYPTQGVDIMEKRMNRSIKTRHFSDGPGKLSKALGIKTYHNGLSVYGPAIWVEDEGFIPKPQDIIVGPRIGVDYAGKDASLPYRFLMNYNKKNLP